MRLEVPGDAAQGRPHIRPPPPPPSLSFIHHFEASINGWIDGFQGQGGSGPVERGMPDLAPEEMYRQVVAYLEGAEERRRTGLVIGPPLVGGWDYAGPAWARGVAVLDDDSSDDGFEERH
ncbi:MAG: hypothetical protein M1826_004930 [Phylliscum demangeonii]|nr:MAG: hypothetical protein M1826_004930 [Phylliscum demangeonii]